MRNYYRNGPEHRAGADVSFADIRQVFGFYSIRIGRWVTATEQQQAANLFFDALCDLQDILHVPAPVISLRGTLALHYGIGGRPGASAHYLPNGRVLALAKRAGGGSLAHEWYHAFDHYIAGKLFLTPPPSDRFASRHWLTKAPLNSHPLNQYLHQVMRSVLLDESGQDMSEYMRRSARQDVVQGCHYFAQPEELVARAFEKVVQKQRLKNHFLVAGTLKSDMAQAGLYPDDAHCQQLENLWLAYFKGLGAVLQKNR